MACRAEVEGLGAAGPLEELTVLEFQGHFSTLKADTLGLYEVGAENASYQLGNISLSGRVQALPRPLYVFTQKDGDKRLVPMAIVKRRILFDSEPELINTAGS